MAVEEVIGADQDLVGLELRGARVHQTQKVGAAAEHIRVSDGAGPGEGACVLQSTGIAGRQAGGERVQVRKAVVIDVELLV